MKIIDVPGYSEWKLTFECRQCHTRAEAGPQDLEASDFKVSGYFFAGTAVCERKLYLVCPTCSKLYMLSQDEVKTVPWQLNKLADENWKNRLKQMNKKQDA